MLRHTRPLTIILLIYSWTSILDLALQIYLNVNTVRAEDCHNVVASNLIIQYAYPIFKQIDELLPLLSILWYFFVTTKRDIKKNINQTLPDLSTNPPPIINATKSFSSGPRIMKGYDTGRSESSNSLLPAEQ